MDYLGKNGYNPLIKLASVISNGTAKEKKNAAPSKNIEEEGEVCSKEGAMAIRSQVLAGANRACDEEKYNDYTKEQLLTLLEKNEININSGVEEKEDKSLLCVKDLNKKELQRFSWLVLDKKRDPAVSSLFAHDFNDKDFKRIKILIDKLSKITGENTYFEYNIFLNMHKMDYSDKEFNRLVELYEASKELGDWGFVVKKCPDDKTYNRAFELAKRGMDSMNVVPTAHKTPDSRWKKTLSMLENNMKSVDVELISVRLDDGAYKMATALTDKGMDSSLVYSKVSNGCSSIEFKRLSFLADKKVETKTAIKLCELDGNKYKEAVKYLNKGYEANEAYLLVTSGLDTDSKETAAGLIKEKTNPEDTIEIIKSNLKGDELERAKNLLKLGVKPNEIYEIVKLKGKNYNDCINLLSNGADPKIALEIGSMDDNMRKTAFNYIDLGFSFKDSLGLSKVNDEYREKADKFIKEGKLTPEKLESYQNHLFSKLSSNKPFRYEAAIDFSEFKLSEFGADVDIASFFSMGETGQTRAINAIRDGADTHFGIRVGKMSDVKYERYKRMANGGIEIEKNQACMIAELDDADFEKAERLYEQGITFRAVDIVKKGDDALKRAIEIAKEGTDTFYVCEILNLPKEQQEVVLSLIKDGVDTDVAVDAAEFSKEQVDEMKEYIKSGLSPITAFVATVAGGEFEEHEEELLLLENFLEIGLSEKELSAILNENIARPDKCSRILKLLNEGLEYSEIGDKCDSAEKFQKAVDEINKQNELIETYARYLNKDPELDKYDKKFLREHAFSDNKHTPFEYIRDFVYFKNLKTPNGKHILNAESLLEHMNSLDKKTITEKEIRERLYGNIEEMMSLNPSSTDTFYLQMFLEFIQEGIIQPNAVRTLCNSAADSEEAGNLDLTAKWELSKNVKKDIDMISDVIAENADKKQLKNEVNDSYVKTYKNEAEALKEANIGDAYLIKGENKIRFKTGEDESLKGNLSKETYIKLFPPVERFATGQAVMGDCYCIESLMALYCDDKTRGYFVNLLNEDSKGNISLKLNGQEEIVFKKGKLPPDGQDGYYSSGADGFKLFEYAYSKSAKAKKIEEARKNLNGSELKEFDDFVSKNGDNIFIYKEGSKTKWATFDEAKSRNFHKTKTGEKNSGLYGNFANYALGNGGREEDVHAALGFDAKTYTMHDFAVNNNLILEDIIDDLVKPETYDKYIVQAGIDGHAYSINIDTDKDGKKNYLLFNPHSQGIPLRFNDFEPLKNALLCVTLIEKKPPEIK